MTTIFYLAKEGKCSIITMEVDIMWWILQILAIFGISCLHTFNRWAGIKGIGFMAKWLINGGAQMIIAPLFILSYAMAPTLFQPWFLGTAVVSLTGFLSSVIFFSESISFIRILGAILGIVGSVLLIIPLAGAK